MPAELFPILLAAAVGAIVWAVVSAMSNGDSRKRVAQRLSSDGKNYRAPGQSQSIVLEAEMSALSKALSRKSFFQKIQKQLNIIAPKAKLSVFVLIAASIGMVFFVTVL